MDGRKTILQHNLARRQRFTTNPFWVSFYENCLCLSAKTSRRMNILVLNRGLILFGSPAALLAGCCGSASTSTPYTPSLPHSALQNKSFRRQHPESSSVESGTSSFGGFVSSCYENNKHKTWQVLMNFNYLFLRHTICSAFPSIAPTLGNFAGCWMYLYIFVILVLNLAEVLHT